MVDIGGTLADIVTALAAPTNNLGVCWIVDAQRKPRAVVTQQDAARLLMCDARRSDSSLCFAVLCNARRCV